MTTASRISNSIPRAITALVLAGTLAACSGQKPDTGAGPAHPDWSGQWARIGSLNWPPEGYAVAGPPPLTEEYQAIWEGYLALQEAGIPAGDPPATCLPPGMPRVMKMSFPMEVIITPATTYIYAEWSSQVRRVYTDGRDWPDYILPSFNGYSIGTWHDENADGVYDMLAIETRAIKGPHSFDSRGVPLHENEQTVVLEEIRLLDEQTLEDRITTIDDALTGPWTIAQHYQRETENIIWAEYVCAENNRHLLLGDEWYFVESDGSLQPTRAGQPRLVPETLSPQGSTE
ncbi:MAG: hypothetical protein RQ899_10590 [Pseudomonadales bacterium]|nr:hypothetical protein [Pseudomonadales bacterium]